jgi:hypothetical protein
MLAAPELDAKNRNWLFFIEPTQPWFLPASFLAVTTQNVFEFFAAGVQRFNRKLRQGRFNISHQIVHLITRRLNVQKPGYDLACIESLAQVLERRGATRRVVIRVDLAQDDLAAIM